MGRMIDADCLEQKLGMLGVSNAYDRPSFWYGKDKKDYKVIPTKYHNGYDNALADVEKAIQELPTIEEPIRCKDCIWWTKADASLQGRCSMFGMYPTGTWFCANAERKEGAEE